MDNGIIVRVLGDYGPFSRVGKSIGYHVTIGQSSFLVECGSPLFQQIGGHALKTVKGLLITHCHDDHKRWFSDLALFNRYAPDIQHRVTLFTTEEINAGLYSGSSSALDTSLSSDSTQVVDIAYDDYIDFRPLGPRSRYVIVSKVSGDGRTRLCVEDRAGNAVDPGIAKIVISSRTGRPRLLFKDPEYGEWIEPDSFYDFSSQFFYEQDQNIYRDDEGFTIEAIKAPVWHGVTSIGLRFRTAGETLVFSADTVHNIDLWQRLCSKKNMPPPPLAGRKFAEAGIIHGDINDYIERVWSKERYEAALASFDNAVVIHDISLHNSIVHTDYNKINRTVLSKEHTLFTHSPDRMTSEWALSQAGKYFMIKGNRFMEMAGGKTYYMNADIYHKEQGRFYVGFKDPYGNVGVYENNGLLSVEGDGTPEKGELLYRVNLYEDIAGGYYPRIKGNGKKYIERSDGKVELTEFNDEGSRGIVVENCRDKLI